MSDSVKIDDTESSEVLGYDSYQLRLGDLMRGERATLGKSLLDVQRDLRIKATYIAAIENCDTTAFQTPGFIAGYVRSYARYLGLDPETTFTHFCKEAKFGGVHPGISRKAVIPKAAPILVASAVDRVKDPLSRPRSTFVPANDGVLSQISPSGLGSVLVLLVLILGLGYGAWAVLQDIQRVEFTPVSESQDILAGIPVQNTNGPDAGGLATSAANEAALDQLYRPQGLDVPVMTPRDGPIAALDPAKNGALVAGNNAAAQPSIAAIDNDAPRVTAPAAPLVAVVAVRPAWVRVSLADGTILFEKILDGGESFQLPQGANSTVLRAGNSGSVYLTLDGKAYGPLSNDSSVAKNVALAPAEILKTYSAVDDTAALAALDSPRVITLNSTE